MMATMSVSPHWCIHRVAEDLVARSERKDGMAVMLLGAVAAKVGRARCEATRALGPNLFDRPELVPLASVAGLSDSTRLRAIRSAS